MKSQSAGFTIVEVLVSLGIWSALTLGVGLAIHHTFRMQNRSRSLVQVEMFRQAIVQAVESDIGWAKVVKDARNVSMECLRSGTPCTIDGSDMGAPLASVPLVLLQPDGRLLFDATKATQGLTPQGDLCDTFSSAGNDACPFRFELNWSALCSPGSCTNPQIVVSAKLIYSANRLRFVFNEARYSIAKIYRMPASVPTAPGGCYAYEVPPGITRLRITAIGGGGSGARATPTCAYQMLSGGGGAGVIAFVTVTPGEIIDYCVGKGGKRPTGGGFSAGNCGDTGGSSGGDTYFGPVANPFVRAGGGQGGNGWHYKNEDNRGTPPSQGGLFLVGPGVTLVRGQNGMPVTTRGACGGDAGLGLNATNTGKGACTAAAPGLNFGGGGYGTGAQYSTGNASAGGDGFIEILPQ